VPELRQQHGLQLSIACGRPWAAAEKTSRSAGIEGCPLGFAKGSLQSLAVGGCACGRNWEEREGDAGSFSRGARAAGMPDRSSGVCCCWVLWSGSVLTGGGHRVQARQDCVCAASPLCVRQSRRRPDVAACSELACDGGSPLLSCSLRGWPVVQRLPSNAGASMKKREATEVVASHAERRGRLVLDRKRRGRWARRARRALGLCGAEPRAMRSVATLRSPMDWLALSSKRAWPAERLARLGRA
jgi:hypothetical protein